MRQSKILTVVGTRPEAIKMAPVISILRNESWAKICVVATGQHRELLDDALAHFDIQPDIDLKIMQPDQGLAELTGRLMSALGATFHAEKPHVVLAQGDTTTTMTTALCCAYHGAHFGHIEAGLRTGDITSPFPEEMNRIIIGNLARWHFAPTKLSRQNLIAAGVDASSIIVTGNTVIDALLMTADKHPKLNLKIDTSRRLVLVTIHRRESFGPPFQAACRAVRRLAEKHPSVLFLYPTHPNPNIQKPAHEWLGDCANVYLCPPLGYAEFVAAMQRSCLILSDSGGVQEEAPSLGIPVLVLRDKTERIEAIECGAAKLVGTNPDRIFEEANRLLNDPDERLAMIPRVSPYGDGRAAERIVRHIRYHSGI